MARITIGLTLTGGALAAVALVAGCATRPATRSLAMAAPVVTPRPLPPVGASATQAIPPIGADGAYRTINTDLSPAATIWHVRSALNVAALGCRGEQEAAIVANYNAVLATKKALLKAAFAQTEAQARKNGGDWRDAHDREMTQTYNFFAQPPAKQRFCEVAAQVAAEAATVPAQEFDAFAGPALARLEAPFTDFYRQFDQYRRDLAAWDAADRTRQTALAAAPGSVRIAIASETAPVAATLAYAPLASVMAWSPGDAPGDRRLASAEGRRQRH